MVLSQIRHHSSRSTSHVLNQGHNDHCHDVLGRVTVSSRINLDILARLKVFVNTVYQLAGLQKKVYRVVAAALERGNRLVETNQSIKVFLVCNEPDI